MKVYLLWDVPQAEGECEYLNSVHWTKEGVDTEAARLKNLDAYPSPRRIEEREVQR